MSQQKPIKYGDVFPVQEELADKPVVTGDAEMMRKAETTILGQVPKDGKKRDDRSHQLRCYQRVGGRTGVYITEHYVPGGRVITETVGDQVVGQFLQEGPVVAGDQDGDEKSQITVGEALEAAAISAGEKAVEISDAAAIKEAELRATGRSDIVPGGITAAAQLAVTHNTDVAGDEGKIKLADVLTDATQKLPSDKVATRRDMAAVAAAEMRNDPYVSSLHPAGVAASVAAAARINESDQRKGDERKFTDFST